MFGIQEMIQKCDEQIRQIKRCIGGGVFHPEDASIFSNQKPADYWELRESLHKIPLSEFLSKSNTINAAYLIPDKLHDSLIFYSRDTDKVPIISVQVAERWSGGDLKVDIVNDETYRAKAFSSGGQIPSETIETKQATVTPVSFGIGSPIGQDLLEDSQWDLVEFHIRQAAKAIGEAATSLALNVLRTATDGWGTVNSGSTGDSGVTKWYGATVDIMEAIDFNLEDAWISNTIITTSEPWNDQISITLPTGSIFMPVKEGFHHCVNNMDILLHINPTDLTNSSAKLQTLVFDRNNALLTGRKRWMQIENYANPVADLSGAIITCRQDSVTLYNDAICVIAET